MNGYPKKKVACKCGKAMHKTHSSKDWACFECGAMVSFHTDPEGTWSSVHAAHGLAVQRAFLANRAGRSVESDLPCMQSEPEESARDGTGSIPRANQPAG